jgi:hypothetical protein
VLEDRIVVPVLSDDLFRHQLLLSFEVCTSARLQRTTEADDEIDHRLRQEQQHDPLTPLANFKGQQKPMTK